MFAALSHNRRNASSDVFSTVDNAIRGNLDYAIGNKQIVYLGAEYRAATSCPRGGLRWRTSPWRMSSRRTTPYPGGRCSATGSVAPRAADPGLQRWIGATRLDRFLVAPYPFYTGLAAGVRDVATQLHRQSAVGCLLDAVLGTDDENWTLLPFVCAVALRPCCFRPVAGGGGGDAGTGDIRSSGVRGASQQPSDWTDFCSTPIPLCVPTACSKSATSRIRRCLLRGHRSHERKRLAGQMESRQQHWSDYRWPRRVFGDHRRPA